MLRLYEAAIFMIKEVGSKIEKISGLVLTDTSEKTIVASFYRTKTVENKLTRFPQKKEKSTLH